MKLSTYELPKSYLFIHAQILCFANSKHFILHQLIKVLIVHSTAEGVNSHTHALEAINLIYLLSCVNEI